MRSSALRRALTVGAVAAVPTVFLGVFFLYPVLALFKRALAPDGSLDVQAVWDAWTGPGVGEVLWFTLWSAGVATLLSIVIGLPVAYALYRLRFPGRGLLRALVTVPFVLPTVVVGLAFTQLFGNGGWLADLHWAGTGRAIVAGLVYFNLGVVVRTVGRYWEDLDPRPAQAAAALGASPIRVWLTVTVRSLLPTIGAAASVVFLFCATAFGIVLMMGGLRYSNLETEIYFLAIEQFDLPTATSLALLQLLAIVVLLLLVSRIRPQRVTRVAQASRRPRWRDAPALLISLAVGIAVLVPLASLAEAAVRVNGHWDLRYFRALATTGPADGGAAPLLVSPLGALQNSLVIAMWAAGIALVLGLAVSFVVTRPRRKGGWAALLDGAFMLPLGVSAATLGFGFLITLNREPLDLRGSFWLIPLAQALVALPLVVRTVVPAWRSIDQRQRDAAATLGAGPLRVLWSVDFAVVRRPALTALGFALAVSMGEFGATSFLARDDSPTLPVVIYRLLSHPGATNFGMAMASATVLTVVTAGLMLAIERIGDRSRSVW